VETWVGLDESVSLSLWLDIHTSISRSHIVLLAIQNHESQRKKRQTRKNLEERTFIYLLSYSYMGVHLTIVKSQDTTFKWPN
jgi:hypothetical protein